MHLLGSPHAHRNAQLIDEPLKLTSLNIDLHQEGNRDQRETDSPEPTDLRHPLTKESCSDEREASNSKVPVAEQQSRQKNVKHSVNCREQKHDAQGDISR